jgi:hypothetical protein
VPLDNAGSRGKDGAKNRSTVENQLNNSFPCLLEIRRYILMERWNRWSLDWKIPKTAKNWDKTFKWIE